ncbi:MAG: GNAT family N-acetyltransferase [Flavobacteriales bacterium]
MKEIEIRSFKEMYLFIKDEVFPVDSVPSFKEIINIAQSSEENIVLLSLKWEGEIVALAFFSHSIRQVSRFKFNSLFLYGFDFFDYNPLFIKNGYEKKYINFLKRYAVKNKIKLIIFDNILYSLTSINWLRKSQKINYFDKRSSEDNFEFITKKKSLNRHKKKLIDLNYSVDHFSSDKITNELIDTLAEFHKERFNFDNIISAFNDEKRKINYLADTSNKLLTVIKVNNEVLAMHYGMLYNDKLIWHTPVLNIKFLKYSPIEILLLETAIYCSKNNISIIDFGLGNEKYKLRFSNHIKLVYTNYFSSELFVVLKIIPLLFFSKYKDNFILLLRKIREQYNQLLNNKKINILNIESNSYHLPVPLSEKISFCSIKQYSVLVDCYRKSGDIIKRHHLNRIKNNDIFYCLLLNNKIVCYGWSTINPLFLSEINKSLDVGSGVLLYDFYTPKNYRRMGYYQQLLKCIIHSIDADLFVYGFAIKSNIPSNKALMNIGFNKTDNFNLL